MTDHAERRVGDNDLRERMVRMEVTTANIKEDVGEIKAMFSDHAKDEQTLMAEISTQIKVIADSHLEFKSDITGRLKGLRWAYAGIVGLAAVLTKYIGFGTHS
jgi:hypothetical protein